MTVHTHAAPIEWPDQQLLERIAGLIGPKNPDLDRIRDALTKRTDEFEISNDYLRGYRAGIKDARDAIDSL